ncbi:MAG: tetratricopeptide repeat protein [Anaerolineae bacterium]|nr:tetratricopeptide repeat protein [Anaerolineae bacterium]
MMDQKHNLSAPNDQVGTGAVLRHRLAPLAAALMLLAACNLNQQQTIIVTATPDATATQTPEPSPVPTETPPPTPTVDPALVLQVADNYLLNGYYENAVSTYQTVLGQNAPQEYAAPAAFRLGQAALREGLFSSAVTALTTFITQYPQDSQLAQAYFLRGDAYLGLSQWSDAIADFQQYLTMRPGLIDSYAYERVADAQLALGQTDPALDSYTQAVQANRTLVPLLALREKVAQVYRTVGRTADAVAEYDAILAVAQNAPYRATIDFEAAQALLDGGEAENGLARMQSVFETYIGTNPAYDAMRVLLDQGVELDSFTVGKVSYLYGDYERAIDALNTYSTEYELSVIPAELHLMLGRCYRELGNSAAAVTAFQTIIDQYPQDPSFGEALLEQGRTKFLLGDIPGAIERYLFIADNYGYLTDTAAEALWRAGYLYGTNDSPTESRQTFERLANDYPNTDQARSGLFLAASAAYKLGETARAEQLYARLASTASGDSQAEAYLWVGRLALQRGDNSTAQETLRLAVQAAPDGYYSARAQDLVENRLPFAPPARYQFQHDALVDLNAAEDWLRQTFGIEQAGPLWPLSAALEADPRLIRGRELWAVAAFDEAGSEFGDLLEAYKNDGLASYQLAIDLRSRGAYQASVIAGANIITLAKVGTLDAPAYIARLRYPIYYLDVVLKVAQEREIDPLLMFSLMRLESLFDANATAAAGEKGLTQVIPSTAEYIANQLNWPNYKHSDLFRPYASIAFGAYYLDEQLDRFDQNVPAALAGYNAGPGRAQDWLSLSGGDPDLFMTTITIDSTRAYVQRMYGFYNIYRTLYGEG